MSEENIKQPIDLNDILEEISHKPAKMQIEWLTKIRKQVIANLEGEAMQKEEDLNKTKALLSDLKDD